MPSFITAILRPRIIAAAAQYRAPAIYGHRFFAAEGGLISHGTDIAQSFVQATSYVDRILKGETPADLPLQPPSRYDLALDRDRLPTSRIQRTTDEAARVHRGARRGGDGASAAAGDASDWLPLRSPALRRRFVAGQLPKGP
jgi:hypothetical protein